jgi:hypothetical protein
VDNRDEVKAFLSSRRAKVTPEQAGLSNLSRTRRVPGLRRSEVADLAGVSVEYYAQLERGNLAAHAVGQLDRRCRRHRRVAAHRSRRSPFDTGLTDLVGELSTRDDALRLLASWAGTTRRSRRSALTADLPDGAH